jgi:hypothetical protein
MAEGSGCGHTMLLFRLVEPLKQGSGCRLEILFWQQGDPCEHCMQTTSAHAIELAGWIRH